LTDQDRAAPEEPDLISVTVTHYEEIFADRADLYIAIKGVALGGETTALAKMQEVKQLVAVLTDFGLKPSDIRLQDVYASVVTGFLGKASAANYHLKILCTDLDKLANILSIVAGQKNTKLEHIEWGYSADSDLQDGGLRDRWLDACLSRANAKAARIASALGVKLLGIRRYMDSYSGGQNHALAQQSYRGSLSEVVGVHNFAAGEADMAMATAHSKWITFRIEVIYRISGRMTEEGTASKQE
jgi:hypothetical protein